MKSVQDLRTSAEKNLSDLHKKDVPQISRINAEKTILIAPPPHYCAFVSALKICDPLRNLREKKFERCAGKIHIPQISQIDAEKTYIINIFFIKDYRNTNL